MEIGNRLYFYVNKALKDPKPIQNNVVDYHRITGRVIKIYEKGKRLTADDIETMFDVLAGTSKFKHFYTSRTDTKRAVMQTQKGVCYLFMESMWTKKTIGNDRYVEIVSNSIDFILGDDLC